MRIGLDGSSGMIKSCVKTLLNNGTVDSIKIILD